MKDIYIERDPVKLPSDECLSSSRIIVNVGSDNGLVPHKGQ